MITLLTVSLSLWLVALPLIGSSLPEKKSDSLPEIQIEAQAEVSQPTGRIIHSGFSPDDPRQRMVAEAYDLWGLDFISLIECENGLRNPKAVWDGGAITKDNQTIGADITVFYKFPDAEILNIARNFWTEVLQQKIKKDTIEAFKQAIGSKTIFDVAQTQEEIRAKVKEVAVAKIGTYPIIIDDIKISNYDWSQQFDDQIAQTMKIAQEAKQQEQQLKKVEIEAQQAVKKAEANKEAERLNAEAMELKGKGVKAYNDSITSNQRNMELEIELKKLEIEKIKAEKWNGQYVPINNYWPIPVSRNRANQGE